MTATTARARTLGPRQLATHLGLAEWQRERAVRDGLIPAPDPATGRWSADVVDQLATRAEALRAAIGTIPDVGAWRAEQHLAEQLGVDLAPGTAAELARRGHLPVRGEYHGPLYCGRVLEQGLPRRTVLAASKAGRLHQRADLAALLQVRGSDVGHLLRAGLLTPAATTVSTYPGKAVVPLYRQADLDRLLHSQRIDWPAVRATRPGGRSPLAALPDARPAARR